MHFNWVARYCSCISDINTYYGCGDNRNNNNITVILHSLITTTIVHSNSAFQQCTTIVHYNSTIQLCTTAVLYNSQPHIVLHIFRNTMFIIFIGDDDEEGEEEEEGEKEEQLPSCGDYVMHYLSLFWKLLFATVPPTGLTDRLQLVVVRHWHWLCHLSDSLFQYFFN